MTQIAGGVQDAIGASEGKGYLVNPSHGMTGAECNVHFDLSVESGKEGKASIKVIGGGMAEKSVNRINFDIKITLPTSGNSVSPKRPVYD